MRIIQEVNAVITRVLDQTVELRLQNKVLAEFPISLFTDKSLLKYGQPLKYQIRISSDGTQYQAFIPYVDNESNIKEEIIQMLNDIQV
jgi:hypothetical protein